MDEINARRLEREEGKKEGLAKGKSDATNQIALNMLKEGESMDKISKFTGLTVEQILEFNKSLK